MTGSRAIADARICIVHNPTAGAHPVDLPALLARSGRQIRLLATQAPGDAQRLAAEAARAGCQIVVAAGGDGTVNEVASGLLGTDAALAILPLGSGNGLARHFGVPQQPLAALQAIGGSTIRRMDVGRINGRPFFATAGLGFDAHVSRHFAASGRRGLRSYVETAFRRYWRYKPVPIRLHAGAEDVRATCFVLAFANAREYGNGARIVPDASVFDGLLDACLIARLPPAQAVRVAWALMRGSMTRQPAASFRRGRQFTVTTEGALEFHVDGDYAGTASQFDIRVEPAALAVAMPAA